MTTAFTTNTQQAASGVHNNTTGVAVTTSATATDTTFTLGFVPRYVCWENTTDRIKFEWYYGMAADSAIKTVAAGTRTLETSDGITVNSPASDGSGASFTIAKEAILASKSHVWSAQG